MERRSHQTDRTLMVKISQAQTPVASIQGGFPPSRVITNLTNPDDFDDLFFGSKQLRTKILSDSWQ